MTRRRKKTFPPGTFIPTPQRLMAIAQLCIAFSLLLWYAMQPFMGEYFDLRSRMLLYEYAMGTSPSSNRNRGMRQNYKSRPSALNNFLKKRLFFLIINNLKIIPSAPSC